VGFIAEADVRRGVGVAVGAAAIGAAAASAYNYNYGYSPTYYGDAGAASGTAVVTIEPDPVDLLQSGRGPYTSTHGT
jgi:hypothetical protein